MSDALEIRLLGPFEVLADGCSADVSGSKRHALLALLALRCGRTVAVDALVDALWGEDLPAAPRNAVQHHVARLRAALGHDTIAASLDGYALVRASVDVLRFEELLGESRAALRQGEARAGAEAVAAALALWRGSALQGVPATAWFTAEARRLESLRVDALEERFEAELALGAHRELIPELRAAIDANPFRERLWGQLMLALYRGGRQADALETFQEARRVLSDELALEPGPELRRLQEAILAQDPAIAPVAVAPRPRGNLPSPSTSFVGREDELARVVDLLRANRLVSLTGPPGVGKSRLAVEAARSLEAETDGAWLVDLDRAGGDADVARLVADAVGARGRAPLERTVGRLRDTDSIVVLDACEHVLEEAGRVAEAVLRGCPGVHVLATSRETLHVAGEVRVTVEPLPLPDGGPTAASPAVDLFVERARAARPGFELTAESAPLVAEISRRVDGLPLAIELAAARVHVHGLAELLSLVERRLDLLRDGPAPEGPRAALAALVAWSYDLLHADERTLVQALAMHRGGASLQSLVTAGARRELEESTVTYLLGSLVDKSVVSASFAGDVARYDLLDTVREYVLERLAEGGELAEAQGDHAEYYAALAEAARAELRGPDWLAATGRLQFENDNFWAALDYARDAPDPALAIRLGAGLGWYFVLAERVSEGRRFVELALAAASEAAVELQVEVLAFLCYCATEELDLEGAVTAGERGLALAADAPPATAATVQTALSLALVNAGQGERAAALADEARAAYEAAGDAWGVAAASLIRATGAALAGDISTVADMAAATHRASADAGFDGFEIPALLLDAWAAERRDDPAAAADAFRRAFDLAGRARFTDHASFALAGLGSLALAAGDLREAEELARAALSAAEAAEASWAAAHARVGLARILAAAGDRETADRLCRAVLEWSRTPRTHGPRESLFVALAGDPAAAARTFAAEPAAAVTPA
jgi:predicted ATPase